MSGGVSRPVIENSESNKNGQGPSPTPSAKRDLDAISEDTSEVKLDDTQLLTPPGDMTDNHQLEHIFHHNQDQHTQEKSWGFKGHATNKDPESHTLYEGELEIGEHLTCGGYADIYMGKLLTTHHTNSTSLLSSIKHSEQGKVVKTVVIKSIRIFVTDDLELERVSHLSVSLFELLLKGDNTGLPAGSEDLVQFEAQECHAIAQILETLPKT